MTMDLGQLTQMTTWLDEEHRRDRAELIRAQQRLETQEGELQDQARIIKDLEGRVMGMQAQLQQYGQLQQALQQLKGEIVQMLAQADERRQQEDREAERVRSIERDNVSRALNEIRRELPRLPRMEEAMSLRKAEQQRMGESVLAIQQHVNALSQEVENKLRSIPFLEDGRQQDAKRIAQLQQESLEALKRLEQQGSRVQMLEDAVQRQERDSGELKELVSQLRTSQREFIEKQLLEIEHFRRQMAEWDERVAFFEKTFADFAARMEQFSSSFREDRQVVESVERFQEAIKREQAQVTELQRLAEERQRAKMEEWESQSEKRWQREKLLWDQQWHDHDRRNSEQVERLSTVEGQSDANGEQIAHLWDVIVEDMRVQSQSSQNRTIKLSEHIESHRNRKRQP